MKELIKIILNLSILTTLLHLILKTMDFIGLLSVHNPQWMNIAYCLGGSLLSYSVYLKIRFDYKD